MIHAAAGGHLSFSHAPFSRNRSRKSFEMNETVDPAGAGGVGPGSCARRRFLGTKSFPHCGMAAVQEPSVQERTESSAQRTEEGLSLNPRSLREVTSAGKGLPESARDANRCRGLQPRPIAAPGSVHGNRRQGFEGDPPAWSAAAPKERKRHWAASAHTRSSAPGAGCHRRLSPANRL